jgi:hypothetical protein
MTGFVAHHRMSNFMEGAETCSARNALPTGGNNVL